MIPKKVVHLVQHKSHSRAFWGDAVLVKDAEGGPDGPKAVFAVEGKGDNRIEVTANELIAGLELYLNDKLVDMTKIKVVSKQKFQYRKNKDAPLEEVLIG